jgi:hypothetical protein
MSSAPATRVFCDSRGLATATSSGSNVACTCEFCGAGASWRCSMKSVGVVGPEKANFRVFKEVACGCAPCRFGRPWKCKAKRAAGGGGGPIAGPQKYFAKSAADAVRIAHGLPEAAPAAATPIKAKPAPAAAQPPPAPKKRDASELAYEAERARQDADLAKLWQRPEADELLLKALKMQEEARFALIADRIKARHESQDWEDEHCPDEEDYHEDCYYDDHDSEEEARGSAELMDDYWEHYNTSRGQTYKESSLRSIISAYVGDPSFQRLMLDKHHRAHETERIRNLATRAWFWESHTPLTAASDPQHVPHNSASISARFIHQRLYRQFLKMLEDIKTRSGYKA